MQKAVSTAVSIPTPLLKKSMSAKPKYANANNEEKIFIETLRKNVNQYFKIHQLPKHAGNKLLFRALFLIVLLLIIRLLALISSEKIGLFYFSYVLTGIIALPIILNIGHDAVHNNFSDKPIINKLGSGVFYLFGTSTYFWKLRHIHAHHAFTNVPGWDLDISQSNIIRLHDQQARKPFHRFQYLYMPFLFSVYTLNWFFYRDIKDIFGHKFGNKTIDKHAPAQIVLLIVSKLFFLFYMLVVPVVFQHVDLQVTLLAFLLFNLSAGLTVTLALVSTHVGENQEFVAMENYNLPYSWEIHQLQTTADFATGNKFITWFFGGFNHDVAHHIFPGISHIHYEAVTPIIKQTTAAFGITYHESPTLLTAIREPFTLLKIKGLKEEF